MPLSEPPESLKGFPSLPGPGEERHLVAELFYRIHRKEFDALYFSNTGEGRFDLRAPRGTLYCSATPQGAFLEVFRTTLTPRAEIEKRRMSMLSTGRHVDVEMIPESATASSRPPRRPPVIQPVGRLTGGTILPGPRMYLADCTSERARAFGITAAIHSTPDYALCQRWAVAFAEAGFDGISYYVSHDPSSRERGIALFQDSPTVKRMAVIERRSIDEELIQELQERFGVLVLPIPA